MANLDYSAAIASMPSPSALVAATINDNNNPDEAAKAQRLSQTTGIPAPVIHNDLPGFTQQIQATTSADLVRGNPKLGEYALSNPMAAKVSSDDWAQLDVTSEALGKVAKPGIFEMMGKYLNGVAEKHRAADESTDVGKVMAEGFSEGYDKESLDAETQKLYNYFDSPTWRSMVYHWGGLGLAPLAGMQAVQGAVAAGAAGIGTIYDKLGIGQGLRQFDKAYLGDTGHDYSGQSLTRDLFSLANAEMGRSLGEPRLPSLPPEAQEIAKAAQRAAPYIESGKPVPPGLHPALDDLKMEESKADLANLSEAMKEAQKSATRERAPELFRDFVAQHTGEQEVGINAETVLKLYGDKVPEQGDGLLGMVPDMAAQVQAARDAGTDVQVPIADLLAHVDPEVYKQIEEGIRFRPDGFTKGETLPEVSANEPQTPVDMVRQAAGIGRGVPEDVQHSALDLPPVLGSVFVNTRNPAWLAARGLDESSLPSWYHEVNTTIQDLANRLNLPDKITMWVGDPRPGTSAVTGGVTTSRPHIVMNSKFSRSGAMETAIHEFGHQMEFQKLRSETPEVRQAVRDAFQQTGWQSRTQGQDRPITIQGFKDFIKDAENYPTDAYNHSFSEWFAEQVSRFITQNHEPTGIVEKFFKGIANGWRMIYQRITGYTPLSKEVDAFMRKHWNGSALEEEGKKLQEPVTPPAPVTPEAPQMAPTQYPIDRGQEFSLREKLYKQWQGLIEKQRQDDLAAATKRAEREQRQTQTAEWEKNASDVRAEVRNEAMQQPRYIADRGIRDGSIPKIRADSLTKQEKAALPKAYWGRNGVHVDEVADLVGHQSGEDLIKDLIALDGERKQTGLTPQKHFDALINEETAARMKAKYGDLETNIIEAAKRQALSDTELDLLHTQLAMALDKLFPGKVMGITKDDIVAAARKQIADTLAIRVNSDKLLADAGRVMQKSRDAMIKGDPAEAFRLQGQHLLLTAMAKEAMEVEKAKDEFKGLARKYSKPSAKIDNRDPEYVNQIQGVLQSLGSKVKRTAENILRAKTKDGAPTLQDFVGQKSVLGRDMMPPDFLLDGSFNGNLKTLTADQFVKMNDFLQSMDWHARDELTAWKQGEKSDYLHVLQMMKDQLNKVLDPKTMSLNRRAELTKPIEGVKSFWWSHVIPETIFNRLDQGDPFGVFNQTFTRMYSEAANYKDRLIKETHEALRDIFKDLGDLNRKITNELWIDHATGQPKNMTREHLLGMLQNLGNASNRKKLFEGFGVQPDIGTNWIFQKLREVEGGDEGAKAALDRAQKIGQHFNTLFEKADTMSRNINGRGIDKLPLGKMQTPWGVYDEWYHPAQEDDFFNHYGVERGRKAVMGEGFYRANTPQGYTKGRTDAVYKLNVGMDIIPIRMNQMIHDIAMRPAVVQMAKFIYDPKFMDMMTRYLGDHQAKLLEPFLRDIAGVSDYSSQAGQIANSWARYFTGNMISTMVGMNPGTIAKHGITAGLKSLAAMPVGFTKELMTVVGQSVTGQANWKMAVEKSDEIARRHQNFEEMLTQQGANIGTYRRSGTSGRIASLRELSQWAGSAPIAFFDMLSSVPTFLAVYKKALADGMSEGDAKFLADRAVRQTHGSSSLVNKPAISRNTSGLARTWSSLYNFFSENLQKQYETAWRIKDAYGLVREGDISEATKHAKKAAGALFTAMLIPGIVDYMVSDTGDKKESWMHAAVSTVGSSVTSGFLGVRDLAYALINGRDPEGGLLPEMMKTFSQPIRDLASGKAYTPEKAGNFLKHMTLMTGLGLGLTNQTEANVAKFVYDYFHNKEHPQGPWQWAVGMRYGTTKGHTRSFDDWLNKEVPE